MSHLWDARLKWVNLTSFPFGFAVWIRNRIVLVLDHCLFCTLSYLGVVRWCWVNFQCRGVLLIWIRVGQGSTALAVGAGGGRIWTFFLLSIISLFFLPLSGRRPDID